MSKNITLTTPFLLRDDRFGEASGVINLNQRYIRTGPRSRRHLVVSGIKYGNPNPSHRFPKKDKPQ